MSTVEVTLTAAEIVKLDLKPTDAVLIRIHDPSFRPNAKTVADMQQRVRETLGVSEVIVLAYGLDLEIIDRKEGSDV